MFRKVGLTILVLLLLIAGLGFLKFEQIQAAVKAHAFTPPPTAVTTIIAKNENWATTRKAVGTAVAVQGVTVSADLPGIVTRIAFDSGRQVHAGDVLVELDTRQERAQLAAAEADLNLAKLTFDRAKALVEQGAVARADLDKAVADKNSKEAKVAEIRATIERKTIHAPFTGVLGLRQVNLGEYLAAGAPIVPLQSLDPIYVNFGVPQDEAQKVKIGQQVEVSADIPGMSFKGKVTAIDSVLDESTRNVRVQATLANPNGKLHPGMFVDASLTSGESQSLISLPASAINYAPFGDSVYVATDLKDPNGKTYRGVRQQFVKIDRTRGDQVAIASGINPGDEVVTSGTFRLRNGAPISVQNSVQPSNNPAPKPEDN